MARGRNYLAMINSTVAEEAGPSKKLEIGTKRTAEVPIEFMYLKRPTIGVPVMNFIPQAQPLFIPPVPIVPTDREFNFKRKFFEVFPVMEKLWKI